MGIESLLATLGPYIAAGGEVAGAVAGNRAAGRQAENATLSNQDKNALARYIAQQQGQTNAALLTENATKDRADRVLTDSKTRAQQVGLGELMQNVKDVNIDRPSYIPKFNISGGLRPSALGPMTKQAGSNLAQQALAAQMSGSDIPDLPDVSGIGDAPPELSPMSEATGLDTTLGYLGAAGLGVGTYQEAKKAADEAAIKKQAALQGGRPTLSAQQNRVPGADSSIVPNTAPTGTMPQAPTQLAQQQSPASLMQIMQLMAARG